MKRFLIAVLIFIALLFAIHYGTQYITDRYAEQVEEY